MSKRNSLIELYRFFFSLIVIKSHGMFPYTGELFPTGRVSVEFFFVLSGYLLVRSLSRYDGMGYKRGVTAFTLAKLKPLALPLLIALPANVLYKILTKDYALYVWGYLWYVHAMIIVFIFYFTLRYFLKNERKFIIAVIVTFVVCAAVHAIPFMFSNGYCRAGMSISLGMLLSYLPRVRLSRWLVWLLLIPTAATTVYVAMTIGDSLLVEYALDLILYPLLIYLTFLTEFKSRICNYLGALSFGLYAFQAIPRVLRELGLTDIPTLFIIIVALAVTEHAVKTAVRKRKSARERSTESVTA